MDILVFGIVSLVIFCAVFVVLFVRLSSHRFAKHAAVRQRIRYEVEQEFGAALQRATGFRRWRLILKREREISCRAGRVIYGHNAA